MFENKLYLIDTNILVFASDEDSIYYAKAKDIRDKARRGEINACISPQILCEFFAIVTDSRRVPNPISYEEAIKEFEYYSIAIKMIYPKETIISKLIELVINYKITRQQIFDAYLIATMLDNEVYGIYTDNSSHFKKYSELEVINPFEREFM